MSLPPPAGPAPPPNPGGCSAIIEIVLGAYCLGIKCNISRTGQLSRYRRGTLCGPCGGTTACLRRGKGVFRISMAHKRSCTFTNDCNAKVVPRRSPLCFYILHVLGFILCMYRSPQHTNISCVPPCATLVLRLAASLCNYKKQNITSQQLCSV
jgi:hypothetical protein